MSYEGDYAHCPECGQTLMGSRPGADEPTKQLEEALWYYKDLGWQLSRRGTTWAVLTRDDAESFGPFRFRRPHGLVAIDDAGKLYLEGDLRPPTSTPAVPPASSEPVESVAQAPEAAADQRLLLPRDPPVITANLVILILLLLGAIWLLFQRASLEGWFEQLFQGG